METIKKHVQNEVTTGEPLEKGGYFVAYNLVMRNVMKVFDLNGGEYACLTILFSYAGADKDKCFPSQEALAEDLNTTTRTVRRYLESLQTKGVIDIYNRQNAHNYKISNVYDLSPCIHKIREIFCKNDGSNIKANKNIKMTKKTRTYGQDNSVLSETMVRTELSGQTGQNCPTTNNTIQITNNIKDIDDDKRASSKDLTKEDESIISTLREETRNDLSDRSFNAVVKKVVDKHKQGKIRSNFRDYLVTSLVNKIEKLELRRMKDKAKSEQIKGKMESKKTKLERVQVRGDIPFYNWLEE